MKYLSTLATITFSLMISVTATFGQLPCNYTLGLFDTFGDGWNGASIVVTVAGQSTTYTLNGVSDDGFQRRIPIRVMTGDSIQLEFISGGFDNEVLYGLQDAEENVVFADGPFPTPGLAYAGLAICPSCPAVPAVRIDDVRAYFAEISWDYSDPLGTYVIEYDVAGFTQGTGTARTLRVSGRNWVRIPSLEEKTAYDFYLYTLCANGDTSLVQGPYSFTTLWANDVGIVAITSPKTECGIPSSDSVSVTLANFGGQPQSLIPFNYSINGMPSGVAQPTDGFFTGVLGKDSTFIIPFKDLPNLGGPGEYVITAWTDLEEDSDSLNDTFSIIITNIPIITNYPYFENFEEWGGGWTVEDSSLNASWAYGQPGGTLIDRAAGGNGAWVTNLGGNYNSSELSYLLSPCLDFSSLTSDPTIAFSLQLYTETCCDEAWMEVRTEMDSVWRKVGAVDTGINWYTSTANQWWNGDNVFNGWVIAANTLEGTAGASEVRVRFVFSSDGSIGREGMAIDNVYIFEELNSDLALVSANNTTGGCGAENDLVTVDIFNFGNNTATGFDINYQVNGGTIVTENVGSLAIPSFEQATYNFQQGFNSLAAPSNEVKVWINLPDLQLVNDTIAFNFPRYQTLPFAENYESGQLGGGWRFNSTTNAIAAPGDHNNPTRTLSANLFGGNPTFILTSPLYSPLAANMSFTFDYRYTLWSEGTEPLNLTTDSLLLQISTDCGATFQTLLKINKENHASTAEFTKVGVNLNAYEGQAVQFRIFGVWGGGDYWLDVDNINIRACSAYELSAAVVNASMDGANDGSITITPIGGQAPFSYNWSTGESGAMLSGLVPGTYSVVVADAGGCEQSLDVTVDIGTAVREIEKISALRLAPNPTSGESTLDVTFTSSVDAQVEVFNLYGQRISQQAFLRTNTIHYPIALNAYPGGLYLIRLRVDGQVNTLRLVKAK
ncbi:MAG: T9SS type A sorting domain-containing protein [Saprospiraceae bacterium]